MMYINIFSFIIAVLLAIWWIWKYFPFYLKVNKTFWYKKPYSITLWIIDQVGYPRKYYTSAHGIFTFGFRNQKKLDEWDSKKFDELKRLNNEKA